MKLLINLIIRSLAVFISAYLLPGVTVDSLITALIVAVVLGIANMLIKPILIILTLPVTILSLGLFVLFINAFLILLVAKFVPGFKVDSVLWAIIFGIVLSIVSSFLHKI